MLTSPLVVSSVETKLLIDLKPSVLDILTTKLPPFHPVFTIRRNHDMQLNKILSWYP